MGSNNRFSATTRNFRLTDPLTVATTLCPASIISCQPITGGRNSKLFKITSDHGTFALKFYRADTNNPHQRFHAETSALQFFNRSGITNVPILINASERYNCSLLSWIDGLPVDTFGSNELDAVIQFVHAIQYGKATTSRIELHKASDNCISSKSIIDQIDQRLTRLQPALESHPDLSDFIVNQFSPAFSTLKDKLVRCYLHHEPLVSSCLDFKHWFPSPVDLGNHNLLQTSTMLHFLDFEFFGWDDPVKLIADTAQHPGMDLADNTQTELIKQFSNIFKDDPTFSQRLTVLFPLFGLKWITIMLNPFVPNYRSHLEGDENTCQRQLRRVAERLTAITDKYI